LAAEARPVAEKAAAVKPQRVPDTSMLAKAKAAMMGATYNAAPRIVELNSPDLFKKSQAQADEDLRARQRDFRQASRDNPWSDVGGAVFSPDPFSKLSLPGRVLAGGGMNALSAYLGEEPGDAQAQREAGDLGFATGVGGTLLGEGLMRGGGKVLRSASDKLRKVASGKAIEAAFGGGQIRNKLAGHGYKSKDLQALGDELLDRKLVTSGSGPEDTVKSVEALLEKKGPQLGGLYDEAGAAARYDFGRSKGKVEDAILRPPGRPGLTPTELENAGKSLKIARDLEDRWQTPMTQRQSWGEAQNITGNAWEDVAFDTTKDPGSAKRMYRKAVGTLRDDKAAQLAEVLGPVKGAEFDEASRAFSFGKDVLAMSEDRALRDAIKKPTWPKVLGGVLGAATGYAQEGGLGAASGVSAGALAGHVATEFLTDPARLAVSSRAGSRVTKWLGETLAAEGSRSAASAGLRRYSLENPEPGDQRLSARGAEELRRYLLENSPKAGSDEAGQHFLNGG
ncbi:MAG: hypothetical protein NTV51_04005, partial [Verrucomicrobia bacterium]|nr:hypothetical protein [Verrucomicrobiota bacterium]